MIRHLLFSLGLIFLLSACSSKTATIPNYQPTSNKNSPSLNKLYQHYNTWRGTPYKYGGLSQSGVDCSGFIIQTYKNVYRKTLPRTTKEQVLVGSRVYINELQTGDLIFFKTGYGRQHVGIYLEKGRFMHASTSKGVIISSISNGYWREHYWQARRFF